MLRRVLLAVRSRSLALRIAQLLDRPDVILADWSPGDSADLFEILSREVPDALIASRERLPEPFPVTLSAIRNLPEAPEVIVLAARDSPEVRASLLSAGCLAVLFEGLPDQLLTQALWALLVRLPAAVPLGPPAASLAIERLSDFVSASPAMLTLLETARRVAVSDSSLLILGETGSGKEWLARAIHAESRRSAAPFRAVNCAALTESLLESELFGHEQGAFTGATRARRGYLELAHRGTIFLDEVAEMPPHLQAKLLRVLQERKIQRLGGEQETEVDVRIMAATNQDLQQALQERRFRPDLYYRLGVVTLTLPPLRERPEDIPALAESYLRSFSQRFGREIRSLGPDALRALLQYRWPGNLRELINVLERAVLLCRGSTITAQDLPESMAASAAAALPPAGGPQDPGLALAGPDWASRPWRLVRREVLRSTERLYLSRLLEQTRGRIGHTAERAGISPRSLYQKMKSLGLKKEDFR